ATYYSIFLKDVQGFTNSELNLMVMISALIYIIAEPVFIKIISKIGNTVSLRAGNILWLVALTFMAFSPIKIGVYIGYTIYQIAFLLKIVEPIILRNNLRMENKETDFSLVESRTYFIYSILTTIIMLVTGILYEYNPYSIVIAAYITTTFNCILAFMIRDEQESIKENKKQEEKQKPHSKKGVITTLVVFIFLSGFLYTGVISNAFSGASVLLKDQGLMDSRITLFIVFGRISRIIASAMYTKIYKALKNKMAIIFPIVLFMCLGGIFLTGTFVQDFTLKISLFLIFIVIIYTLRDPFILFIQDTIFTYVEKENQRYVVSTNSLFYKLGNVITCLLAMIVLNSFDQKQYICYGFMTILVTISLVFSTLLYNKLSKIDKVKIEKS
ncbi:MAG: MFS transporter, partial [Clostridia bacterium]|nr:MFS transporter [Clostridia bacterium]